MLDPHVCVCSTRDLEDWFYRYGRLRRVDLKRNYAFVEFDL